MSPRASSQSSSTASTPRAAQRRLASRALRSHSNAWTCRPPRAPSRRHSRRLLVPTDSMASSLRRRRALTGSPMHTVRSRRTANRPTAGTANPRGLTGRRVDTDSPLRLRRLPHRATGIRLPRHRRPRSRTAPRLRPPRRRHPSHSPLTRHPPTSRRRLLPRHLRRHTGRPRPMSPRRRRMWRRRPRRRATAFLPLPHPRRRSARRPRQPRLLALALPQRSTGTRDMERSRHTWWRRPLLRSPRLGPLQRAGSSLRRPPLPPLPRRRTRRPTSSLRPCHPRQSLRRSGARSLPMALALAEWLLCRRPRRSRR
eukprot:Opistho-1_new@103310